MAEFHRPDGVDITVAERLGQSSGRGIRITVPQNSGAARYAYEVIPTRYGRNPSSTIRIVRTNPVSVSVIGPQGVQADFIVELYEVPNVSQVPQQGSHIEPTGRRIYPVPAEAELSPEQRLFQLTLESLPIVGGLLALAETVYAIRTGGRNLFGGPPLQQEEVELMGLFAGLG